MAYTVRNEWINQDETADTMLELMKETRVFSVKKADGGCFEFEEECDKYFGVTITKEQMLALSDELRSLAESA